MMVSGARKTAFREMKKAVDGEIRRVLENELLPQYGELHEMMAYQMGFDHQTIGEEAGGKRLRPIFLLLTCQAAGGDWRAALPAAAAVELLHNFTLIHDDIEDQSPVRHGRPSVWKKWNIPLAINAGDTMFSLAILALGGLQKNLPQETVLQTQQVLYETCVHLTYGQHLDISNEGNSAITIDEYLKMVEGKTAALIGASMKMGMISAGKDAGLQEMAYQLGISVGMAFQVIDDILGIWGEAAVTGKSNESDLISRKLSLPVIFGIQQKKEFFGRWSRGEFSASEVPELAAILEKEGARRFSESKAEEYTARAMSIFEKMNLNNDAAVELQILLQGLISRAY